MSRIDMRDAALGADIARDRSRTAVVVAGWADHPTDGEVIVAELHLFDGSSCATEIEALALRQEHPVIAVNGIGHMRVLTEALVESGLAVVEAKAQDVVDANGRLLDALRARRLRTPKPHRDLTAAVQHARVRSLVDGQALDKRGADADLCPLMALELAVWCLESQNRVRPFIL